MTTFLLKFLKKINSCRNVRDIFVDSLVLLGYIVQNKDGKYELTVEFDKERFIFRKNRRRLGIFLAFFKYTIDNVLRLLHLQGSLPSYLE